MRKRDLRKMVGPVERISTLPGLYVPGYGKLEAKLAGEIQPGDVMTRVVGAAVVCLPVREIARVTRNVIWFTVQNGDVVESIKRPRNALIAAYTPVPEWERIYSAEVGGEGG